MGKVVYVPAISTKTNGVAKVANQQQEDSLNIDRIQYVADRGYMTVKQKAHQVEVTFDGQQFNSRRVFAIEVYRNDKGEIVPTGSFTALRISNLRQTHFGEVIDGKEAPKIPVENREEDGKLHMVTTNVTFFRAVEGSIGLGCKDLTPFVKTPTIFWYQGDKTVYTPDFENRAIHADEDGNLALATTNVSTFVAEPAPVELANVSIADLLSEEEAKEFELD